MNEERPSLRCGEDPTGKEVMGAQSSLWTSGTESRTTAERGEAGALGGGLADRGDYLGPVRMG